MCRLLELTIYITIYNWICEDCFCSEWAGGGFVCDSSSLKDWDVSASWVNLCRSAALQVQIPEQLRKTVTTRPRGSVCLGLIKLRSWCVTPGCMWTLRWPLTRLCSDDLTGFYMYIETSRPRLDGDKARLLSPTFNMNSKSSSSSSSVTNNPTYCFAFYYHMYGKHIGKTAAGLRCRCRNGDSGCLILLLCVCRSSQRVPASERNDGDGHLGLESDR